MCLNPLGCVCVRFWFCRLAAKRLRGSALTGLFIKPLKKYIFSSWSLMWQLSQQLSENPILSPTVWSSIFRLHIDPSLRLCLIFYSPWTSPPLPSSISNLPRATYTSVVPINTSAQSHCSALWPSCRLSEHTGPEAGNGFSISLSQVPVGQVCDRWVLVSSADPPCRRTRFGGVREHWLWCCSWQGSIRPERTAAGEDKRRARLWMRCC